MSTKLYVGNLSFDTTQLDLQDAFAEAGSVAEVAIVQDRTTGQSRGFAFVTMSSSAEAQKAIELFHGKGVNGRSITVSEARPREERGSSQGRSFGSRGGNGGGGNRGGGSGGGAPQRKAYTRHY